MVLRLFWLKFLVLALLAGGFVLPVSLCAKDEKAIDFNRDIRPILSDNCYYCHGPDEKHRKAKMRLDTFEGATADRGGYQPIVPGDPKKSELVKRIGADDTNDLMPPPESNKKLTPEQKELLTDWIASGAEYKPHWAFITPEHPELPTVKKRGWPRNEVDWFILAELEKKGLSPSREAPKEILIRRLKFDLTGLPPTPEEVDAFLKDKRKDAYERLVDRFMRLPAYGEHQAKYWLDAVRYGDTHGLHLDNERSMWPYRDWVVKAFNANKRFDQFTLEQLAGDLLPNPARHQLVASGYNRCNVTTSEGGAIDEEFYVRYAVDRTETTGAIWMGLTLGCAVCHDHKFDPVSQKEFYQMYAFFNNAADKAMDGNALLPPPTLKLPTLQQAEQMKVHDAQIADFEKRIREAVAKVNYADPAMQTNRLQSAPAETVWVEDDFPAGAKVEYTKDKTPTQWLTQDAGQVFSGKRALKRSEKGVAQDFFTVTNSSFVLGPRARLFAYVYLDPADPPKAIMLQFHTGNWNHRANWGDTNAIPFAAGKPNERTEIGPLPETGQWVRLEVEAARVGLKRGDTITGIALTQSDGTVVWDKAGMLASTDPTDDPAQSLQAWLEEMQALGDQSKLPQPYLNLAKMEPAKRNDKQNRQLRDYYLENVYAGTRSVFDPLHKDLQTVRDQRAKLDKEIPATMIMAENEKLRPAHLLKRGQYDQPGEIVERGVPAALPPLPPSDTTNRLDLAKWLVSPNHPLTARVTVNRLWQQFFGVGLVKTANDFGRQGEYPSHPELLDWLATEFIAMGWDIQKFQKLVLTSATYRQSSAVTPELLEADPENRLYARGPRFRLDAEVLRDNALFVSGLLNSERGGRGVRPYQPPGIWEAVGYTTSNTAKYTQDHGDALYRRSLYLFWKRTAPPPSMTTLDAPSRESSCTRRERTNTPLQALLMMNDVAFMEAARHLGQRILREGGSSSSSRLRYGFRLVTSRYPDSRELSILDDLLKAHLAKYREDDQSFKELLGVGESPVAGELDPAELAAYTMVANLLLNLDETVTKN